MQQQPPGGGMGGGGGGLTVGFPSTGRIVKQLLLINAACFLLQIFVDRPGVGGYAYGPMSAWLGVTVGGFWQLWRYVTFQFLHGGPWHIILNMLGLWLLGSPLEKRFGTKRFLVFYLSCGVVAGIAYVMIGAIGGLPRNLPIIGASGGVYGIVLAAAVLFPHFRLLFLFFPVPIRLAAVVIFGVMVLTVLQAAAAGAVGQAMSDVAHLGGAVCAAFWLWGMPRFGVTWKQAHTARRRGTWQKKMRRQHEMEAEVDRILAKVREQGLDSLTAGEKRKLREATRRQQERDRRVDRM
jgi:membrane associated rhomboid family serine protease